MPPAPRLMPLGIISSVSIVTLIYTMMCVTLNLMVPRDQIDEGECEPCCVILMMLISHIAINQCCLLCKGEMVQ
jgi:amino acid transporter